MILIPVETGQSFTTLQKTNKTPISLDNRLSVHVAMFGLSFLVSGPNQEVLAYKKITFQDKQTPEGVLESIKDTLQSEAYLKQASKVTLIYNNPLFTLVPQAYFKENHKSDFLKFNTKILPGDLIAHDNINPEQPITVYIPWVNINNFFYEEFGSFTYYHTATWLLKKYRAKLQEGTENLAFLHAYKHHFYVFIFKNNKLVLSNVYTYNCIEDVAYYVLFCFEQLQIKPHKASLFLNGHIKPESALEALLKTYVETVQIIPDTESRIVLTNANEVYYDFVLKN